MYNLNMKEIIDQKFSEERALYNIKDTKIINCRFEGIEDGETKEMALANLYKNNEWIKTNGFLETRMRCYAILKPERLEILKNIINDAGF